MQRSCRVARRGRESESEVAEPAVDEVDPLHAWVACCGTCRHCSELPGSVTGDGEQAQGEPGVIGFDGVGPAQVEAGEEVGVFAVGRPQELEVSQAWRSLFEASLVGEGFDLSHGLFPGIFEHGGLQGAMCRSLAKIAQSSIVRLGRLHRTVAGCICSGGCAAARWNRE